jgi:hypothetical protein
LNVRKFSMFRQQVRTKCLNMTTLCNFFQTCLWALNMPILCLQLMQKIRHQKTLDVSYQNQSILQFSFWRCTKALWELSNRFLIENFHIKFFLHGYNLILFCGISFVNGDLTIKKCPLWCHNIAMTWQFTCEW